MRFSSFGCLRLRSERFSVATEWCVMVGHRLKITRRCTRKECGKVFRPWFKEQKTCSASCRNYERNAIPKTSVLVMVKQTCKECGRSFEKPHSTNTCSGVCASRANIRARQCEADKHEPKITDEALYEETDAPPGSREKVEILRQRMESGFPLWHSLDRVDFAGLRSEIRIIR